jgi:hypothetical protein
MDRPSSKPVLLDGLLPPSIEDACLDPQTDRTHLSPALPVGRPIADLRSLDALRADPPASIGDLVDRLGQAGFGLGILFAGAINLFAPVPGLGQAAAVLACLLAFQIARGDRHPWLPPSIRTVALPPEAVARTLASAIPWMLVAPALAVLGAVLQAAGIGTILLFYKSLLVGILAVAGIAIAA